MDVDDDLESVGEQLYNMIYPKHTEIAGKLTGMLLELPGSVLTQMLQDEAMLTEALDKALRALHLLDDSSSKMLSKDEDDVSVSSDSLGEQLFELIDVYNTGYSHKITGMLLEQHKEAVLHLLSEPNLLEEQVNQALKTLKEPNGEESDVNDSSDTEDIEHMGEKLFSLVRRVDPVNASDITGMLLELEPSTLLQMLVDHSMLEVAVHKAQAALESCT